MSKNEPPHTRAKTRCGGKVAQYSDLIGWLLSLSFYGQATHLSNAEDLFKFLYKKGIGGKHAHFWVGWALHAENAGNFPMAEK